MMFGDCLRSMRGTVSSVVGESRLEFSVLRIRPSNQSEGSWRMVAASRSSSIKLFDSLLVVYTHPRHSGLMRQPFAY